ncbi:MAG: tRNA (N6-isopentenyl adenosine(37)-C2)-methylthiotransferase MiaB [Thermoleophilia bacterium]
MLELPDTFYLRTFGCQMNEHDSERIAGMLDSMGLRRVVQAQAADVLVYNTCSIREKADTRLLGHLGEARRLKSRGQAKLVVVAGCLAQSRRESFFEEHPYVDVLVGPQSLHELPELILSRIEQSAASLPAPAPAAALAERTECFSAELPRVRSDGPLAWVQIMTGCTNYCSYCIVPYVRGPEASRPADDILAEIRSLVDQGVREVTLLGQNVNAYGSEEEAPPGPDFAGLLNQVSAVEGLRRIRFMTSHPKDVSPDLIRALAELEPVCEHLHLPVQSGSNRILAAMRRGYTREHYLDLVGALRSAVPEISLTTDLIVGFPGETEEDFKETLDLVEEVGFDAAFTFIYSPRMGTRAAALPGRISPETADERMTRLVETVRRAALARNQALIGRRVEVLVEGPSRNSGDEWAGRTRTFKMVNFAATSTKPPSAGDLVEVEISAGTSASLRGRVVGSRAA